MNNSNDSSQNLETKITSLEQKVEKLQDQYARLLDYLIKPSESKPGIQAQPLTQTQLAPGQEVKVAPLRQEPQNRKSEVKATANLLPLVAVICFVLSGVFLVKLAIDSGWLTPERQWGLVSLLGASLIGAGRFLIQIEKSERIYLSAAGIIILYIAAYSSHLYFKILSPEMALGFAVGVSIVCLGLFQYYKSEFFAVICSVGTYISPLLLGSQRDLIFDSGFFIIWACVFSIVASFLRTRMLSLTAAYLGIGVFTVLYASVVEADQLLWISAVLATQFFIFTFGVYYYSLKNKAALAQKEVLAYLPILLFFYGTTYYFINKFNSDLAPWISLGFAAFVYLIYYRAKQYVQNLNSQLLVQSFLGVVIFHSGYLQILPDASKPWLLPIFLLLAYISEKKEVPKVSSVIKTVLGIIGLIEFGKICFDLAISSSGHSTLPAVLTIALGLFYYSKGSKHIKDKSELFLGLVHLLSILAIFRILYSYGSFAVSVGWGIYAAGIFALSFFRRDPSLAKSSLVVLLVASLKALVYDASQAPSGVRILSLLVTGIILYLAGIFLKKIDKWQAPKQSSP